MKLKTLLVGAVAGLLLTACGGGVSPEDVTKSFVEALAAGDCEKAIGMSVESAKETVEESLKAGCDAYKTEITSIECARVKGVVTDVEEGEVDLELVTCKCDENREGQEMTYKYDLKKVDGEWKVANFEKDFNIGDMGMGQ
jgi:hypothetical protein